MSIDDQIAAKRLNNILLITGGTGTLGQEIVKQLTHNQLAHNCDKIIIYSRDEQKQNEMEKHFAKYDKVGKLRYFIGDIRDQSRLELALKGVTHVIHAAALKIVPTLEYNPSEAIKTNIHGTQNLIEVAAKSHSLRKMLAISTDKAVYPINLYGSTKLTMEKLFMAASNLAVQTKFAVCRYGNVTGSRGSVIPLFQDLIAHKHPLTITDPNMTRFWITQSEAAKFVLDRLDDMENGEIYVPDMQSYRLVDLINVLCEDEQIRPVCRITGIRPGEKIHEAIITEHEFTFTHTGGTPGKTHTIINKIENKEYVDELRNMGIPMDRAYTSRMAIMTEDQLREKLIAEGIKKATIKEAIYEKTYTLGDQCNNSR